MDQLTTDAEPLQQIRDALQQSDYQAHGFPEAIDHLNRISLSAREASQVDLASFADVLSRLLQVVLALIDSDDTRQEAWQVRDFVRDATECLDKALQDDPDANLWMAELCEQAEESWGDCLQLFAPLEGVDGSELAWQPDPEKSNDGVEVETPVDSSQIGLILGSLDSEASSESAPESASGPSPDPPESEETTANQATWLNANREHNESASPLEASRTEGAILKDPEIREAYLDDAQRCLASVEASLMAYEEDPTNSSPIRQVCRELHTLKGASASVGLSTLANFLHAVEDDLQTACDQEGSVDLQPIFKAVDAVREQMNQPVDGAALQATPQASGGRDGFVASGSGGKDSVRVKSHQLDRLMDMLAELVMLRNRRESRVEQLKEVHNELIRCVSRLRAYEENYSTVALSMQTATATATETVTATDQLVPPRQSHERPCVSSLTEIANDLLEMGGNLRGLYDPLGDENIAISRFIRQFRQELIQLRRVPIGGLFQRLQRAARDASRVEGKKVRLQTLGDEVGLESSIQQQLYEPLMHIVRNSVSHGIESESQRVANGKSAAGTVTLEAHGGSNLMVITVRDDGRGLDYDALRRRGVEMGLIAVDRHVSRADLARLIFHPGFSTRKETNAISGRGVGMDVVATALERMHSWIEVDSVPGQGTSVRLLIPLRSVIEHVMVFRAGGQEFGIPTQFVRFAGSPDLTDTSDFPMTHISHIFEQIDSRPSPNPQLFVLARGWNSGEANAAGSGNSSDNADRHEQRLGLLVDEIVGPEEVVVRPLPSLLGQQPLFTGVTLSGTGDIMLLFDSKHLLERGLATGSNAADFSPTTVTPSDGDRRVALVVDDSRSARRTLVRLLQRRGFQTDEASDGVDASRQLKNNDYDIVFTDLEMPEQNGMDLLREIRRDSRTSDIPVVIVSSRAEDTFRERARELGVSEYLTKPVSDAVITQTLTRLKERLERTSE